MLDIFDAKENYLDRFADNFYGLRGSERFCHIIDKNVFLSVSGENNVKICSNHANCKNKDGCKLLK